MHGYPPRGAGVDRLILSENPLSNRYMNDIHDIVIIGGGPAGLTAGLYAARARLKTLLVEQMGFGGQLLTYEKVENYPGFPEGIGAFGLGELISAHALKFGLQTRSAEVVGLELSGDVK